MTFQNSAMAREAERATLSARPGGRHMAIAPPPDRELAVARARRRSARTGLLRKAILISGLGTVAAMVANAIFNPFATKFEAPSFSKLSLVEDPWLQLPNAPN